MATLPFMSTSSRLLFAFSMFVSGLACAPGTALRATGPLAASDSSSVAADTAHAATTFAAAPIAEPIIVSMDRADVSEQFASALEVADDTGSPGPNVLDLPTHSFDQPLRLASVTPANTVDYYGIDQLMRSPQMAGRARHGHTNSADSKPSNGGSHDGTGRGETGSNSPEHPQTGTPVDGDDAQMQPGADTPKDDGPGAQTPTADAPQASPSDQNPTDEPKDPEHTGGDDMPAVVTDNQPPPVVTDEPPAAVSVPEPSSLSLLALGLLGLATRRRRARVRA